MNIGTPIRTSGPASLGYWLIVLSTTFSYTVNSACAPLITYTTTHDINLTASIAGTVVSSAVVTSLICMVLSGKIVDYTGPRTLCLLAEFMGALSLIAPAIICSVPMLLINRVFYGAANAAITVATTVWIVYNVSPSERGKSFAYYGVSVWVGLAVGPVISESIAQHINSQCAWGLLAIIQLISFILIFPVQGEARRKNIEETNQKDSSLGIRKKALSQCMLPCCVALIAWGIEGAITTFLVQHLSQYKIPATGLCSSSSLFGLLAMSVILCRIFTGNVPDRYGAVATTAVCMIFLGLGCILLAFSRSLLLGALSMVLIGFAYSPLYPSLTLLITQLVSSSNQSTALGIFSASTSAGYYCGAFIAGALIEHLSSPAAFLLLGFIPFLCLPALLLNNRRKDKCYQ